MNIRQAQYSDLPYVYEICHRTGYNGKDASEQVSDRYIIGQYYAAPYIVYKKEHCFIAEKENIPCGYVLSAFSTEDFYRWMNNEWLPPLRERYPADMKAKSVFEKTLAGEISRNPELPEFISDYPSHLHIDLLPEIQGIGLGRQLMNQIINRLREDGSKGIHLGVSDKNEKAAGFYERLGFLKLKKVKGAVFMGVKLQAKA
ncbi:MAG: GNAT family N-acetyltransferase [Spirochaetales bacterium]|nr:GNAT family N-acetyltransferase [Spirochaetales bacterium]